MKIFNYVGICAVMLFSFYYTEKIANYVLEKNALYQEINEKSSSFEVPSVSAVVDATTMVPGLNGKSVHIKESYYNMKSMQVFNSYYLVYKDIFPEISIEKNKDKIITKGNPLKNSVAIVLEYDKNIIEYLKDYNFSVLVDSTTFDPTASYEQINNEIKDFEKLDSLISKYVVNPNLCVIHSGNEAICRDKKKYLVQPTKTLSDGSIAELKNTISSGDIILIQRNTKLETVAILLRSILFKDYDLNILSKHINEER